MSERDMETGSLVTKATAAPPVSARLLRRWRDDLRSFERLARKARARVRGVRGLRSKLHEATWIARKARERIARRLKSAASRPISQVAHTREAAVIAQRMALSALAGHDPALPACASAGGGVIIISVGRGAMPSVFLRDSFGNLHRAALIDQHLLHSAAGEPTGTRLVVQTPAELLGNGVAALDVVLRTADEQVVFGNVPIETAATSVTLHSIRFENSCVSFSGGCAGGKPRRFGLGLFVDGALSASCTIMPDGPDFSGVIALDHMHLDGRSHLLELRETSGMSILASLYQLLPLHITPWNALQTYARPPLDGTLSQ
ncbi:MAG: hypothetical protein ACREHV_15840, partial [Rhizomicrobium sp.]